MLQDVRVVIETAPRKLLHKPPRIFHIPSLCFPPVHASPFDQHGRNCQEAQNLASIDRNAQVSLLLFGVPSLLMTPLQWTLPRR
jgi:hypothetical protein